MATAGECMFKLFGRGEDSVSLLNQLMELKGHVVPLPDFANESGKADKRLQKVATKLGNTLPDLRYRDIGVKNEFELAAALDMRRRGIWFGNVFYDKPEGVDQELFDKMFHVCGDVGLILGYGLIVMADSSIPTEHLNLYTTVWADLFCLELFNRLKTHNEVEVQYAVQADFLVRLHDKYPDWVFVVSVANGSQEEGNIRYLAGNGGINVMKIEGVEKAEEISSLRKED